MPTYEYACRDCNEHLEVVQSFKDDPLTECGLCGGRLRKVFSAAGIIFKGSGYYVTDTRAEANSSKGSLGSDSGEDGASSDTASKDTSSGTSSKDSSDGGSSQGDKAAKSA